MNESVETLTLHGLGRRLFDGVTHSVTVAIIDNDVAAITAPSIRWWFPKAVQGICRWRFRRSRRQT